MTSTLIANTQPKIISDSDCRIKLVGLGRNEISHHLENFGIEKQKLKIISAQKAQKNFCLFLKKK